MRRNMISALEIRALSHDDVSQKEMSFRGLMSLKVSEEDLTCPVETSCGHLMAPPSSRIT